MRKEERSRGTEKMRLAMRHERYSRISHAYITDLFRTILMLNKPKSVACLLRLLYQG
jgi:hypothetical protein